MSAAVIAVGALSPLGRGVAAYDVTVLGAKAPVAIVRDAELEGLGFARPFAARVQLRDLSTTAKDEVRADRATHLLFDAFSDALTELERIRPGFRAERIGVAIGTSSGGMRSAEDFFTRRARKEAFTDELARSSTYFAPFETVLHELGLAGANARVQLVTACAASTWAIGLALRWLEAGLVDVAFAGGYDAIGPFVAAGFECIRATSASIPSPFRLGRDGMALGEGAGVMALVRHDDLRGERARFYVTGFGASTDAVHITAPDRTGAGLARAAGAALGDAGVDPSRVEMVSAHGTSTPYNDAMEARAIATVFGAHEPLVHAFKAQIGHTLGAAGVLETLSIAHAMVERVWPACAGVGAIDPDARVRLVEHAERAPTSNAPTVLKESAAFGGANAALVLESKPPRGPASPREKRTVHLRAAAHVTKGDIDLVALASATPADRIARIDELSLLAATSLARLLVGDGGAPTSDQHARGLARVRGGGVIVGHALATLDINERFYARILARGPTSAEPRVFPPTSPNLVPGQLAILFGLTGPSAAVCGSLAGSLEALDVAYDLVAHGDADRMLVVALDLLGPTSQALWEAAYRGAPSLPDGAVAVLLDSDPRGALRALDRPSSDPKDELSAASLSSKQGLGHMALARAIDLSPNGRSAGEL